MLYKFLTYVNSTSAGTTYSSIAYYICNHFSKVCKMNLEELADACYVSQATISRFCRSLGFESFTNFKAECQRSLKDGERRVNGVLSDIRSGDDEFKKSLRYYGEVILKEMKDLMDHLDLEQMDALLDQIYQTEDVAFFGIHRCASIIQELQFSFALRDKFVKAYTGSALQLECAKSLGKDSLAVVVVSADDGFWFEAHDVMDALAVSPCSKILLTTTSDIQRKEVFDDVILIGSGDRRTSLYTMTYYSEAIISRYFSKYQSK